MIIMLGTATTSPRLHQVNKQTNKTNTKFIPATKNISIVAFICIFNFFLTFLRVCGLPQYPITRIFDNCHVR